MPQPMCAEALCSWGSLDVPAAVQRPPASRATHELPGDSPVSVPHPILDTPDHIWLFIWVLGVELRLEHLGL